MIRISSRLQRRESRRFRGKTWLDWAEGNRREVRAGPVTGNIPSVLGSPIPC